MILIFYVGSSALKTIRFRKREIFTSYFYFCFCLCLGLLTHLWHPMAIHLQTGFKHSRSKESTDQRVLVFTLKFLALKKTGVFSVKMLPNFFFTFVYLYSMQVFNADPTIFQKYFESIFCANLNEKMGLKSRS